MNVADVAGALEKLAPLDLAESWDNVGLLAGDRAAGVRKLLLCIDLTEAVLHEAATLKAEMVLAYHPLIFKPIARVTAEQSPLVYQAIRRRLAVYCPHTALDAAPGGADDVLADVLGLVDRRPLLPIRRPGGYKVVIFAPAEAHDAVSRAAFDAGAGRIGKYYDCGFFGHGVGTFCGGPGTHPTIGQPGRREAVEEVRLEMLAPADRLAEVLRAARAAHPYEEPAIDIYPLQDVPEGCGSGRVGRLRQPATIESLVRRIKRAAKLSRVLIAQPRGQGAGMSVRRSPSARAIAQPGAAGPCVQAGDSPARRGGGRGMLVTTAAVAAGAAGSRHEAALAAGASFLLTGEMRHHDALAAVAAGLTVVCLGHSNSERIALASLAQRLRTALPKLQVVRSQHDADPFQIV
jgi:putative NIF3 family GTP cyclohydrolase 1 type 2